MINNLLVLHLKHPRYGYRRITIKLREKGWFILNEFPGYGVRKAVKYAGNSIRSFAATTVLNLPQMLSGNGLNYQVLEHYLWPQAALGRMATLSLSTAN